MTDGDVANDDLVFGYGLVQQWCVTVYEQCRRVEDEDALWEIRVMDADLLAIAVYQLDRSLNAIDRPFAGDVSACLALRHALTHPEDRDPELAYTIDGKVVEIEGWVLGPRRAVPRQRIATKLTEEARAIADYAEPFAIQFWNM